MSLTDKQVVSLGEIAERLLEKTHASRTTIRLCATDGSVPLVAEACAQGVMSMAEVPVKGVVEAPTYRYLIDTQQLLIQDDLRSSHIHPPRSLIDELRVFAQMLAPVIIDGSMVATISVHQQDSPRMWDSESMRYLEFVRNEVREIFVFELGDPL